MSVGAGPAQGVLARDQPKEGRKLAWTQEVGGIIYLSCQCRGSDETDTGDRHQTV